MPTHFALLTLWHKLWFIASPTALAGTLIHEAVSHMYPRTLAIVLRVGPAGFSKVATQPCRTKLNVSRFSIFLESC